MPPVCPIFFQLSSSENIGLNGLGCRWLLDSTATASLLYCIKQVKNLNKYNVCRKRLCVKRSAVANSANGEKFLVEDGTSLKMLVLYNSTRAAEEMYKAPELYSRQLKQRKLQRKTRSARPLTAPSSRQPKSG